MSFLNFTVLMLSLIPAGGSECGLMWWWGQTTTGGLTSCPSETLCLLLLTCPTLYSASVWLCILPAAETEDPCFLPRLSSGDGKGVDSNWECTQGALVVQKTILQDKLPSLADVSHQSSVAWSAAVGRGALLTSLIVKVLWKFFQV